jgi:hypothetical protein
LAKDGLARLGKARRAKLPAKVRPAFTMAAFAAPVLQLAARDPLAVGEDRLVPSEFRRRAGLAWAGWTGRF